MRNLVERRSLLFQLVRRDFEQRFVGSAVGWIWGLIHPLVLLLSWTFVFQYCMQGDLPKGVTSYPLFLFTGMLPWLLFSETLLRSAPSLLDQANLITKTVFPAEIVPISVFLSTLISHLLALTLVIATLGLVMNQFSIFLFMLPFYMAAGQNAYVDAPNRVLVVGNLTVTGTPGIGSFLLNPTGPGGNPDPLGESFSCEDS